MKDKWLKIIRDLSSNPRDLHTVPKVNKAFLWFYAYSDGKFVYIENAKEHISSSKISVIRKLSFSEFERIYPIYLRREHGESVSQEATMATVNQVYWYSIFSSCLND